MPVHLPAELWTHVLSFVVEGEEGDEEGKNRTVAALRFEEADGSQVRSSALIEICSAHTPWK